MKSWLFLIEGSDDNNGTDFNLKFIDLNKSRIYYKKEKTYYIKFYNL